jgi:hypothetical protein
MEYAYDLARDLPLIMEFDIEDATAILKGELVRFTDGYIVAGGSDYTTPYLGVAAEDKDANDGKTRIHVYCSPSAVYKVDPIETTVSATPSTTDWLDTVTLLNTTADIANGGKLKIKEKAAAATGTFNVGDIIPIVDSATNHLIGAAASFPGSTTVGDVALFFPAINKLGPTPTATNGTGITWAATSGTALRTVGHDLDNNKVLVQIKLHSLAN